MRPGRGTPRRRCDRPPLGPGAGLRPPQSSLPGATRPPPVAHRVMVPPGAGSGGRSPARNPDTTWAREQACRGRGGGSPLAQKFASRVARDIKSRTGGGAGAPAGLLVRGVVYAAQTRGVALLVGSGARASAQTTDSAPSAASPPGPESWGGRRTYRAACGPGRVDPPRRRQAGAPRSSRRGGGMAAGEKHRPPALRCEEGRSSVAGEPQGRVTRLSPAPLACPLPRPAQALTPRPTPVPPEAFRVPPRPVKPRTPLGTSTGATRDSLGTRDASNRQASRAPS